VPIFPMYRLITSKGFWSTTCGACGAHVVLRGLRAVSDFEFELTMALMNRKLDPNIETMYIMTSMEYSFLSSSIVKEVAGSGGDIHGLVPEPLVERVSARCRRKG